MDLDEIRKVAAGIPAIRDQNRRINDELRAATKRLKDNQKYLPDYIASESQRQRGEAHKKATAVAASLQADIPVALAALAELGDPRRILNHAVFRDANERAAVERMRGAPSARIKDIFTEATRTGQWALAGACIDEVELRAERAVGTPAHADLQSHALQLQSELMRVPNLPGMQDVQELHSYLTCAQDWLGSTLRSIASGEFDSGLISQSGWETRNATPEERRAAGEKLIAQAAAA